MLAIRLQRTGRRGHAQFRFIVQDRRSHPTRGKVVAYLGSYDPHSKTATVDSQKTGEYLTKGAQPSDRVALLLKKEGIKLPAWVNVAEPKKRAIRNPEKLRRNRPAEEKAESPAAEAAEAEAPQAETSEVETAAEPAVEAETPEAPTDTEPAQPAETEAVEPSEPEAEE